jgi:hypothetical protein
MSEREYDLSTANGRAMRAMIDSGMARHAVTAVRTLAEENPDITVSDLVAQLEEAARVADEEDDAAKLAYRELRGER